MIAGLLPNFDERAFFLEDVAFVAKPFALVQIRQTTLDELLEDLLINKLESLVTGFW